MQAPAFGSSETLTWEAPDPRADGRRRGISLSRSLVVIARKREGVAMRITMRPNMFRGVLLRLCRGDDGVVYEVKLVHADPDLSIALASMADAAEAERAGKPGRASLARARWWNASKENMKRFASAMRPRELWRGGGRTEPAPAARVFSSGAKLDAAS